MNIQETLQKILSNDNNIRKSAEDYIETLFN